MLHVAIEMRNYAAEALVAFPAAASFERPHLLELTDVALAAGTGAEQYARTKLRASLGGDCSCGPAVRRRACAMRFEHAPSSRSSLGYSSSPRHYYPAGIQNMELLPVERDGAGLLRHWAPRMRWGGRFAQQREDGRCLSAIFSGPPRGTKLEPVTGFGGDRGGVQLGASRVVPSAPSGGGGPHDPAGGVAGGASATAWSLAGGGSFCRKDVFFFVENGNFEAAELV